LLCGVVKRRRRLSLEEIEAREEIVRAAPVLETRDELEKDSVDPVSETSLIPLHLTRMFLAFEQQEGFHVAVLHRVTG